MGKRSSLTLENLSGWRTGDLERFFRTGLHAMGVTKRVQITVVSSPIRSRGCAEVGGSRMVIAIASPIHFSRRRLARMFEHEAAHLSGLDHDEMPRKLLYSHGKVPDWAKKIPMRYVGRAPNQMPFLKYAYKSGTRTT